jgi:hypothetical protein
MKADKVEKGVRATKVPKSAQALKAARVMEKKVAVYAKLRECATPLEYGKITPDQAYTLGIVVPGLVPDVSFSSAVCCL